MSSGVRTPQGMYTLGPLINKRNYICDVLFVAHHAVFEKGYIKGNTLFPL